jgi:hypothetical protein
VLVKSKIAEMTFAAALGSHVCLAESLKDNGMSLTNDSCCLMATSAMIWPEIKFCIYLQLHSCHSIGADLG